MSNFWKWATTLTPPVKPMPGETHYVYRLSEFSTGEFFRGFTRWRIGDKRFFTIDRSASYALGVSGLPFAPWLGHYMISSAWRLTGWGEMAAYFVLVLLAIGSYFLWLQGIDMIFWPRYRVITDAKESQGEWTSKAPLEFKRNEVSETKQTFIHCLHPDDLTVVRQEVGVEPATRKVFRFLIKVPFYLAGGIIALYVGSELFGKFSSMSLNTTLLIVIIVILLVKE
jgi:hypothetical protein